MNKKTTRRKISDTNKLHQGIKKRKNHLRVMDALLKIEKNQFELSKKEYEAEMVRKLEREKTKIKYKILEKTIEDKFLQIENQIKYWRIEIVELIKKEA